jgi:hypothetical protein
MKKNWSIGIGMSLIMAASVFAADFPARTFFNARGVMETPFGKFFTGFQKRSDYCPIANASVTSLPPTGSSYGAELSPTLLYSVDAPMGPPVAKLVRVTHRVDGNLGHSKDFPAAGIDTFPSTFINGEVLILSGPFVGRSFFLPTMIDPAQEVARGAPFVDGGPGVNDSSVLPLPPGSMLPSIVSDANIIFPSLDRLFEGHVSIAKMNGSGQTSIHLEIISLDARSADGAYRIISGRQMLEEYPQLFAPSFGIVVSNSRRIPPSPPAARQKNKGR